jgi:hypothetical protein
VPLLALQETCAVYPQLSRMRALSAMRNLCAVLRHIVGVRQASAYDTQYPALSCQRDCNETVSTSRVRRTLGSHQYWVVDRIASLEECTLAGRAGRVPQPLHTWPPQYCLLPAFAFLTRRFFAGQRAFLPASSAEPRSMRRSS